MRNSSDADHDSFGQEAQQSTRNFMQVIWQRKAFVILGAVVGLALGFLWHSQKTTIYSSTTQMLIIQRRQAQPLQSSGQSISNLVEDYMATHMILLRSPIVIERAVGKRNLASMKTFEGVTDPIGYIQGSMGVARDSTKETSGQPNNIMSMSFRGPVSEDCGKVLDAVVDAYQEFLDINYRNVSDQTLELITKARDTLKGDMQQAEGKYLEFRLNSPIFIRSQNGLNVEQERVAAFEAKRSQMKLRLTELNQRISSLKAAERAGRGAEVLGYQAAINSNASKNAEARTRGIEEPLIALKIKLHELEQTFGDDHPDVKGMRSRIVKMREELEKIAPSATETDPAKVMLATLEFEKSEIDQTILAMDSALVDMMKDARNLSAIEIQEAHLRNEVTRIQQVYESTIKRLQEINIVRDSGGFEVRVLSRPGAGGKISPIFQQDMSMGLMLGLLVGVGLAYLADLADKSFRSPDEIRKQMGLPLVGHIPFFQPDPETSQRRASGDSTIDPMLCTYFKPKSIDSEAYRAVRTSMFFATQGQGLKVIQVTSPNKGDGKSLLISNLAITTAQSGKRVLLIDADCRRPRQHKVFNVRNDVGLVNVLNGAAAPADGVHETVIPGLFVMGSGPIPPNPSELLVSPRFKELLDGFREEFDYVFVDTPPLLAVTDPCIVAGKVDGLFLAIRLTRKGRPDAERAREILQALNVRTFGIVVNGVTRTNGGLYSAAAYDYSDKYINYEEDENKAYYYADEDDVPSA